MSRNLEARICQTLVPDQALRGLVASESKVLKASKRPPFLTRAGLITAVCGELVLAACGQGSQPTPTPIRTPEAVPAATAGTPSPSLEPTVSATPKPTERVTGTPAATLGPTATETLRPTASATATIAQNPNCEAEVVIEAQLVRDDGSKQVLDGREYKVTVSGKTATLKTRNGVGIDPNTGKPFVHFGPQPSDATEKGKPALKVGVQDPSGESESTNVACGNKATLRKEVKNVRPGAAVTPGKGPTFGPRPNETQLPKTPASTQAAARTATAPARTATPSPTSMPPLPGY